MNNCNCSKFLIEKIELLSKANENNNDAGDATWILTSAFIIFTMQSGFGLLEAGSCSPQNECNIMVKNAVDVIFGAFGYYICGFGFSFGEHPVYSNGFTGFGYFLPDGNDGHLYAKYFFQLSFATTATTIVSGAMAERTNLKAYMLFSFLNFFSYVFPAHWVWDDKGFLKVLGVVDIAGCGPVHIVGGAAAFVATVALKPRIGKFDKTMKKEFLMASPTNVVLGTFMLWWGWLGFNCGSTFGVSGGKWLLASKAAVVTVNASVGGGLFAVIYSYYLTKKFHGKLDVATFTGGILAGLVSITAVCAICSPWEALIIGFIGGIISTYGASGKSPKSQIMLFLNSDRGKYSVINKTTLEVAIDFINELFLNGATLLEFMKVDDPVNCVPIHLFCGIWGMVVVGLVGEKEETEKLSAFNGVFKGGNATFLGYQLLASLCIMTWATVTSIIELFIANLLFGLRQSRENELIGADLIEHGIKSPYSRPDENDNNIINTGDVYNEMQNFNRLSTFYGDGMINFGFVSINNDRHLQSAAEQVRTSSQNEVHLQVDEMSSQEKIEEKQIQSKRLRFSQHRKKKFKSLSFNHRSLQRMSNQQVRRKYSTTK